MTECLVVVPCYNEAERLNIGAFKEFVAQGHPQTFLFVNDGSTDDTSAVLAALHESNPGRFAVHELPRNKGKAEAVRQGMLLAFDRTPAFIGFWDADLATPLDAIPAFCRLLENNPELQMVLGARVKLLGRSIERRAIRHYLGRVFATAASLVLKLPVYDTQCGAKVFRATPEIRSLFDQPFRANWVFDVELLARFLRARKASGLGDPESAIHELPLAEWRDVAGSKVSPCDFLKVFFELIVIYYSYLRPGARG